MSADAPGWIDPALTTLQNRCEGESSQAGSNQTFTRGRNKDISGTLRIPTRRVRRAKACCRSRTAVADCVARGGQYGGGPEAAVREGIGVHLRIVDRPPLATPRGSEGKHWHHYRVPAAEHEQSAQRYRCGARRKPVVHGVRNEQDRADHPERRGDRVPS